MSGCGDDALARWCRICCLVGATVLPAAELRGEDRPPTACRFEAAGAGKVRTVADGRSFTLEDGREVRLAGIEVPLPPRPGGSDARAAGAASARAALAAMLGGGEVEIAQDGAAADRYGRLVAFAYVMRDGARRSAAHEMLREGFARVSAHVGDRACAAELLAQERAARQAKLGLWSEPYYAILGAESTAELAAERGRFALVEGRVLSVRESGATIYMNFGRRWSQALTVTIAKRDERAFAAAGMAPKRLENRRVRVRGWIEDRNGPRIAASRPEQIEIAERN
ncbi:MAG TPA: thermonuclease family protein [Xanthobacteraceae bacterium]|jgi:endonuclease YncB( thermonuclease family)